MDLMSIALLQIPILVFILIGIFYYRAIKKAKSEIVEESPRKSEVESHKNHKVSKIPVNKSSQVLSSTSTNKRHDRGFSHPWLVTTLKGHTGEIHSMDFSSNGKYLASCGDDRQILIWSYSQLEDAKNRKSFRVNVEFDSATKLAWSPDNKAIIIHKAIENCIEVYKLERKDGWFANSQKGITFPQVTDSDIIGFGIACTGRFIMTCTNKTDMFVWDLKGNILEKLDTVLMNTYTAKVSPCGRFIAAGGFSPDVKVWEVKFSRTGEFQKVLRAFDLSGHSSGIYDIAFDQDTSHIATISKDGTWKLYDVKIEYEKGQSPRCLKTGKYTARGCVPLIALSQNAEVLAIANGSSIELCSTATGDFNAIIKNVFDTSIVSIAFDSVGKYLFVAGDKHIRVFHNITGYKTAILLAEAKLKTSSLTAATRERIENQIIEYQTFLKKFS